MSLGDRPAYSYRTDAAVPAYADDHPLIVFDGACVLCSAFARFVARHDREHRFRFAAAQSPLGQALYRHYGLDPVTFETNLLIENGVGSGKLKAFAQIMTRLGWPWRAGAVVRVLPRGLGDQLYDVIARTRFRLFGRTEACAVADASWRDRIIG